MKLSLWLHRPGGGRGEPRYVLLECTEQALTSRQVAHAAQVDFRPEEGDVLSYLGEMPLIAAPQSRVPVVTPASRIEPLEDVPPPRPASAAEDRRASATPPRLVVNVTRGGIKIHSNTRGTEVLVLDNDLERAEQDPLIELELGGRALRAFGRRCTAFYDPKGVKRALEALDPPRRSG